MTQMHVKKLSPTTVAVAISLLISGVSFAQDAASKYPLTAEVTGSNVYVRSGPSQNHYPVTKLGAGERVTVVNEKGEWAEILAPDGTFSLISGDYVDTPDDKTGVVNGDNVLVRAGSVLPDFANDRSSVQTKLSRGTEVKIIARLPDGFLQIVPPASATLWLNKSLIAYVDGAGVARPAAPAAKAAELPAVLEMVKDRPSTEPGVVFRKDETPPAPTTLEPPYPIIDWTPTLSKLRELDELAYAEMQKRPIDRKLEELVASYQRIAEDAEGDEIAVEYANARVRQLNDSISLIETLRKIQRTTDEADSRRREHLAERAGIREVRPLPPTGLEARGELKPSAIFKTQGGAQRFRLVDTQLAGGRTIGYVEIPVNSTINVEAFVGQYVGVRASETKFLPGGSRPIPVYVASELIVLQRDDLPKAAAPVAATPVSQPKP
jgi:SH3-like domain-containing protein